MEVEEDEVNSLYSPVRAVGIYGVGQAAAHPPALAVLSYCPPGATKTIAWVGKGIVYDTGGICLKTRVRRIIHTHGSVPVCCLLHSRHYYLFFCRCLCLV